jgi:threonine synthase
LGFAEVMLAGLARDGGLYVPEAWPTLDRAAIAGFAGRPYAEAALDVIRLFTGDSIAAADLARMVREAYGTFRHPAVVPLSQLGSNTFALELFHGPTLAFKDVAMQLLARLMDHALAARGERRTIVVATSGDTGGAAVEAFGDRNQVDLIVLFPKGRVSDVQQRMMTTANAANIHALAIDGTFDDCQAIVKGMFNHTAFRDRVRLSGAAPQGRVHGADREFRRHLCRLCGAAFRAADRPARHRHQRQRHSGAHACDRHLRIARGGADDLAVDGHSGLVEFRAAPVRRL